MLLVAFIMATSAPSSAEYPLDQCASCHEHSQAQLAASVHGSKTGVVCTDCHATHGDSDARTSNAPLRLGRDLETCGQCHADEVATYRSTYHGKHAALGKANVPTCAFCHAGHELPRADPGSPLYPANVARTCAGCHADGPDASSAMTAALDTPDTGRYLYRKHAGVQAATFALAALTLGVFAVGVLFLLQWIRVQRGEPRPNAPATPRWLLLQLAALVLVFLVLEQSGVALLYASPSDGVISGAMSRLGGMSMAVVGSADARSLVHRLAAVALLTLAVLHVASLFASASIRRRVRMPAAGWSSVIAEARRGIRPRAEPGTDLWPAVYRLLLLCFALTIAAGIAQWQAFSLMQSWGFGVVRYANAVHEWMGRSLAIALYGVVLGGGIGLRAIGAVRARRAGRRKRAAVGAAAVLLIATFASCSGGSVPARPNAKVDAEDIPLHGSTVSPPMPGTTPRVFPSAETCQTCHAREYAEWKESFHSQSVSLDTFRAMYTIFNFSTEGKRPEYCFYCHAPESKLLGESYIAELSRAVLAGDPLPSEGVTCAACHMIADIDPSGHGWSAPARYQVASAPPYHELFKSQLTSSSAMCSGCHDYDNLNLPRPGEASTPCCTVYRGWEQTPAAKQGVTCQDCHMGDYMNIGPDRRPGSLYAMVGLDRYADDRGAVSHVMPGSRSAEMLQKAVAMRVVHARARDGRLQVEIEIENRAGHNIPDG